MIDGVGLWEDFLLFFVQNVGNAKVRRRVCYAFDVETSEEENEWCAVRIKFYVGPNVIVVD